jgi:oligopeptide/dipeptide ABC transporter ATP-binding protein|tara:strand:+ start:1431 stop:2423 length:993 start_codon:yes stop_codon:yes gene_type:complete
VALLEIKQLNVALPVGGSMRPIIEDLSFEVEQGQSVGLVGESGSGKTMTARAILGLLPEGAQVTGEILLNGKSVLRMDQHQLRQMRVNDVAMIFQDPRAHINPVRTIGDFLMETMIINHGYSKSAARSRSINLLEEVGLPQPEQQLRRYPHELSGGMLQRVMIASTLHSDAKLLLADEPTTALDVTIQSEVMALISELQIEHSLAMILITHDLDLAVSICQKIAVLYAGTIMEMRTAVDLYNDPHHPYSSALAKCRPSIDHQSDRLVTISGSPMSAFDAPKGCVFSDRCEHAVDNCKTERPGHTQKTDSSVRCHRSDDLRGALVPSLRWT